MHLGNARTALYNYLAARHHGAEFVLRIEDTDNERSEQEHVDSIQDALQWLGIEFDGVPVIQSSRAQRHREVIAHLIADGRAYFSQDTREQIEEYKAVRGRNVGFRGVAHDEGAVRLRLPSEGRVTVTDLVFGDLDVEWASIDDPVIARSDGTPLYNLAVTIDDLDAGITHVVRGEDHRNNGNTTIQTAIYNALDAEVPVYAHLPLILGDDGRKMGKRHGAPSVQELRASGYVPEAVFNYLALLGWGDLKDRTVLSRQELVEAFDLTRVSRNGARFDDVKLRWLNGQYLRSMDLDPLTGHAERFLGRTGLRAAVAAAQPKLEHSLHDLMPLIGYAIDGPADDPRARRKWLKPAGIDALRRARDVLATTPWTPADVHDELERVAQTLDLSSGKVFQPVRVALTGTSISPGIGETVCLLDRDEALARIDVALQHQVG